MLVSFNESPRFMEAIEQLQYLLDQSSLDRTPVRMIGSTGEEVVVPVEVLETIRPLVESLSDPTPQAFSAGPYVPLAIAGDLCGVDDQLIWDLVARGHVRTIQIEDLHLDLRQLYPILRGGLEAALAAEADAAAEAA